MSNYSTDYSLFSVVFKKKLLNSLLSSFIGLVPFFKVFPRASSSSIFYYYCYYCANESSAIV